MLSYKYRPLWDHYKAHANYTTCKTPINYNFCIRILLNKRTYKLITKIMNCQYNNCTYIYYILYSGSINIMDQFSIKPDLMQKLGITLCISMKQLINYRKNLSLQALNNLPKNKASTEIIYSLSMQIHKT